MNLQMPIRCCRRTPSWKERAIVGLRLYGVSWRHRVFVQVLELNRNGSVGFQKPQKLKVHPIQAVLLRQQPKNHDDADDLAVELEWHAGGQIFLPRWEGRCGPAIPELTRPFIRSTPH